jgi:hypothetical protein
MTPSDPAYRRMRPTSTLAVVRRLLCQNILLDGGGQGEDKRRRKENEYLVFTLCYECKRNEEKRGGEKEEKK